MAFEWLEDLDGSEESAAQLPSPEVDDTARYDHLSLFPITARAEIHGNPDLPKPEQITDIDLVAQRLGASHYEVAADLDGAKAEVRARDAESASYANKWVAQDPQNASFLGYRAPELRLAYDRLGQLNLLKFWGEDIKPLTPEGIRHLEDEFKALSMPIPESGPRRWWAGVKHGYNVGELQRVRGNLGAEMAMLYMKPQLSVRDSVRIRELDRMLDTIDWHLKRAKFEGGIPGLHSAMEQVPRMFWQDIPAALAGAGAGAGAGAIGGSAGGPVGAGAGALTGAAWGAGTGFGLSAAHSEMGNYFADRRNMLDDAGKKVDRRTIALYSVGYGGVSGTIEVGLTYVGGKAVGAPLKKAVMGTGLGRKLAGGAVGRAAAGQSMKRAVAETAGGLVVSAAAEGTEEVSQKVVENIGDDWMRLNLARNGRNYFSPDRRRYTAFDPERSGEYAEAFLMGAGAGFWIGAGPSVVGLGVRAYNVRQAQEYAAQHQQASQVINQHLIQDAQLSPARAESFLQVAVGMDGNVLLPADAVLELQQKGVDIAGPMGWEQAALAEAAATGEDITVPVARLHARLAPDVMGQVAQIMRPEDDNSYSAADAVFAQTAIDRDVQALVEEVEQQEADTAAFNAEAQRIRNEITETVRKAQGLNTALVSSTDTETSVSTYVNTQMQMLTNAAMNLSLREENGERRYDLKAAKDTLSRLYVAFKTETGLSERQQAINDMLREAGVDPGASLTAQRREMDLEFDHIYGRVEADSVADMFGKDAVKELRKAFGLHFFAPKGKGERIENLAEEYLRDYYAIVEESTNVNIDSKMVSDFIQRVMMTNKEYFDRLYRGRLQQIAYHGTPHRFDKFTLDHIGAGEGAQVHGWGLYFAAGRDVAEGYRQRLIGNKLQLGGQVYGVDIPDNHLLLDEQKLFSEQPEAVQSALRQAAKDIGLDISDRHFTIEASPSGKTFTVTHPWALRGSNAPRFRSRAAAEAWAREHERDPKYQLGPKTGKDLYLQLSRKLGNSPEAASKWLNEHGVKGITYDGRQDGRSFVVFDDQAIQILETYYQQEAQRLGETAITADGSYFVSLFKGANLSTLTHELGHVIFNEFERVVASGQATERLKNDWQALQEWLTQLDDDAALKGEYEVYQKGLFDGRDFSTLTAGEKEGVRARARQEWLARGLEQYLREGTAPTPKTEGMFRRFAKWLSRVYRQAEQLNVELTDEVRGVMSRLLASEEDIEAAAQRGGIEDASAALLDALGLKGAERLALQGLIQQDKDRAAASLRKQREAILQQHRKQWEEWAREDMAKEPVYAARDELAKTPLNWDDFVAAYGLEMAMKLAKKLPGSISRKATGNADVLAANHGFANGGVMAQAILDSPGKRERLRDIVSTYREAAERELDANDYLYEQGGLAEQQEKIGEAVYRLELAGRTQGGVPVGGNQLVARSVLRGIAENIIGRKNALDACNPTAYRRQAARYMRLEREAILDKKWADAIQYNNKARINLALEEQARRNRDAMTGLAKRARRFLASKVPDPRARFGVYLLARQMGLFPMNRRFEDNAADKTLDDWHAWTEEMRSAGFYTDDAEIADSLLTDPPQAWQGLIWEDLRPSLEALMVTMHMDRAFRKERNQLKAAEWKEFTKGLAEHIRANVKTVKQPGVWERKKSFPAILRKFNTSMLHADTIALMLDDDHDFGPVWEAIVDPIRNAVLRKGERIRVEGEKVRQLFSVYSKQDLLAMRRDRIWVQGLGEALTKEQMLCVLLNSGNADNKARMMQGRAQALTEENIQEIIDMLDERDVQFAQSVWDYFETFRKEAFDQEERITGVRPHAVEATPVMTRHGQLRGGYYPIRYDSERVNLPLDTENSGPLNGNMVPSVDHGSMKQRGRRGLDAPVLLELDVIPSHVMETVHMLELREPVRDVARILNDHEVAGALRDTLGKPYEDELRNWLSYVAGKRAPRGTMEKALRWARKNQALVTMGFSLSTALAQITGLIPTMSEIGPRWVAEGVLRAYVNHGPRAGYEEAMLKSDIMRNRINNASRDIFEFTTKLVDVGSRNRLVAPLSAMQDFMAKHAFKMMGWTQMVFCDLPTWHAAYAKGLANGMDDARAAKYADLIVERTQGSSDEYNLSTVQHGGRYGELVMQLSRYYTYWSALYNMFARRVRQASEHRDASSWGRLATLALLTWTVEPTIMAIVFGARPDDEDDESWGEFLAKTAAKETLWSPWNMVVGARDVTNALRGKYDGYGGRYRPVPAADTVEWGINAANQIGKYAGGRTTGKRTALTVAKGVGYTTGLINNQEIRALEVFWDWLDDTTPELEWYRILRNNKANRYKRKSEEFRLAVASEGEN